MRMLFRRMPLVLALLGAAHFVPIAVSKAEASTCAKKKKKKKAADDTQKKVTSVEIVKWHKAGLGDEEIVARADAGGFKMTALALSRLKKARTPKSLIAALSGKPVAAPAPAAEEAEPASAQVASRAEAPKVKPININDIMDPNDIDFDSVPPPSGIPREYQSAGKVSRASAAPAKKQLDRSTRPSAPFESQKQAQPSKGASAGKSSSASAQAGKKRVVFAAKEGGG